MKNKKTRRFKIRYIVFGLLGVMALAALVFMRFGGLGTGENVNPEEFLAYAEPVENITVPESAKIIALGEATHGNAEFQQLKLEVFKLMVKNNGVRAFALEGDYGGCEQVNRYIHGGEGTAQEAAAAIGFSIYRTEEMAELISYMRQYNESALEGEDLRFYGFDMQRISYSMRFLEEVCKELEVDTTNLQKLVEGENWSSECDLSTRTETLTQVKKELESKNGSENAIHFVDILMQHSELQTLTNDDGATLRDQFMAENVQWILQQEQRNGHEKIFVTGHNSHVAKWGSFDSMGKLLSKDAANGYYVIGTDFYKTHCNMPTAGKSSRMGDFKPMLQLGSISIAQRVINNFRQAGISKVVVVTGYHADVLECHLASNNVVFLRNENYANTHMFDSVRIGLEYLKDKVDTVLFTPVDVPLFTAQTVTQMLSLGRPLVTPVCNGNPGHPILIRSTLIDSILSDDGKSGLKGAVDNCGEPMYYLNVKDPGIIHDADTPEDYAELLRIHNQSLIRSEIHIQLAREKVFFDEETEQIIVRTTEGDIGILAGHENYVADLPAGPFRVKIDGKFKVAAISGGALKVSKEAVTILAMAAEWAEDIDPDWAKRSQENALKRLNESKSDFEHRLAELKLKRALNRIKISSMK